MHDTFFLASIGLNKVREEGPMIDNINNMIDGICLEWYLRN